MNNGKNLVCVLAGHSYEFEHWRDLVSQANLIVLWKGNYEFETENNRFRHISRREDLLGVHGDYLIGIGTWEDKLRDRSKANREFFQEINVSFNPGNIQLPFNPKLWIGKNGKQIPDYK